MAAAKKLSQCYFVTGSDEAGVKRSARALADELAPGADAFGMDVIDGAVDSVEACVRQAEAAVGAVLTMPFLGGRKLVWLKSATFLQDTVAGRSESVLEVVERLCGILESGLPEGITFLLSAPGADKRRSAYKRLVKACDTRVVDMPNFGFGAGEEALVDWTAGRAIERGVRLEPGAVEALAARVGLNPGQLEIELDKLHTAFGTAGLVGPGDVRLLVPQTRDGGIFDLSNAIQVRDLALALETLEQLFRQGEKAVGILLAAIVPTVRSLLLMKDLSSRHRLRPGGFAKQFAAQLDKLAPEETSHLPRKKDGSLNAYPLSLSTMHAANYSLPELQAGFRACATAAQQLFSGTLEDDVVLARLLVGILARS
jgi:DNA polymerase III subunit delta